MSPRRHAAFDTRFPPDEGTFAGRLMLDVAGGLRDRGGLDQAVADVTVYDDFAAYYPDEPALEHSEAVERLEEVIAEHNRVVTAPSDDARALEAAVERLAGEGVAISYAEGWDKSEAASEAFAAAHALQDAVGYGYCTVQDVERMVLGGPLFVGFSAMSGDIKDAGSLDVARRICRALEESGLTVDWDGTGTSRIAVRDIVVERPFEDGA